MTRPEGDKRAEWETGFNLGARHFLHGSTESGREGTGRAGLDLDLGHFERAESDVGEYLSRGGTSEPDEGFVFFRVLLAGEVHVGIFEDFIETVLEHSLQRVTDKGGSESFPDTARALLSDEGFDTWDEALIFSGVHLKKFLSDISRRVRGTCLPACYIWQHREG